MIGHNVYDSDDHLRWLAPTDLNLVYMGISHLDTISHLDIINQIENNMDNKMYSCGIFIDLKKAFDIVDHLILLQKLDHHGVRGVTNNWFASYLLGRQQTTQIGAKNI